MDIFVVITEQIRMIHLCGHKSTLDYVEVISDIESNAQSSLLLELTDQRRKERKEQFLHSFLLSFFPTYRQEW